jgi:hypothetical protein
MRGVIIPPVKIIGTQAFIPSDMGCPIPCCGDDGVVFYSYFAVGPQQMMFGCHKINRSSVLGIAQNGASNGGSITVNGAGNFNLPCSQFFHHGSSFDRRCMMPPGTRGTVGGISATLFGWL